MAHTTLSHNRVSPTTSGQRGRQHDDRSHAAPHEQPWPRRTAALQPVGPLAPFIENYIDHSRLQHQQATTYSYKRDLSHLAAFYPQKPVDEYTRRDIEKYLVFRTEGLSPRTRKKLICTLRAFFSYLTDNEIITRDPARAIKSPRLPEIPPRYLSPEQVLALFRVAIDKRRHHMVAALALGALAGLRVSSIHGLLWDDVDFEQECIHLVNAKGGKTNTVPLHPDLARMLTVWRQQSVGNLTGYVIAHNYRGDWKVPYYTTLNKNIKRLLVQAGLPDTIGFHDLRRTFATTLYQNGAPIPVIQQLLGHSDSSTTIRHYTFTTDAQKTDAIGRLHY